VATPWYLRTGSAAHSGLYRLSRGRLGRRIGKAPVLLLTTTGRKTGQRRTVPLLFIEDAGDWIVVASNGGRDEHPGWWRNLSANPNATIQAGARLAAVSANEVSSEERERLWPRLAAVYPSYDAYTKKTERRIPVVRLHPDE
jgi:deazaflavin-dependent oxidoreductase (nitroreductase family)